MTIATRGFNHHYDRNKPASQIPSLESFDLIWLHGNSPVSLREDTNKEV